MIVRDQQNLQGESRLRSATRTEPMVRDLHAPALAIARTEK